MMEEDELFHGYKVVPLKMEQDCEDYHVIYMKEHYIKAIDDEKPRGRTIFLLNVPPYIYKEHLKYFFDKITADVASVSFSEKPGKDEEGVAKFKEAENIFNNKTTPFIFKCAYIVFNTTRSVQKALKISEIPFYEDEYQAIFLTGLEKYKKQYLDSIIPEHELQIKIDTFMAEYDAKEAEALRKEKTTEPDDNGWITVGKRGKNAGFEQKESTINRIEEKMEKNKKTRELKNFYTFQIRENKMKDIFSLRKKFEEDKKKIENMKQHKRFKPF